MHHANVLIGDMSWALAQIPPDLCGVHADVRTYSYERMSIADARALIEEARLRPVERSVCSFIIATQALPIETQNALLKLFEDPTEHALFFLILPRLDMLIPTLRSRVFIYAVATSEEETQPFAMFVRLGHAGRMAEILEKTKVGDEVWMRAVLHGAQAYFKEKKDANALRDVLYAEQCFARQGSSKKMLLEHIAMSL